MCWGGSMGTVDDKGTGLSRRDALKTGGAAAAGAMAMFAAIGSGTAGAATPPWQQTDYANFAKLVNACWKSSTLLKQYHKNPQQVLAQYHIQLPPGTPPPTIPPKPSATLGKQTTASKAWGNTSVKDFQNWNVTVSSATGGVAVSTLCCIACPWSCFSTLSNSK